MSAMDLFLDELATRLAEKLRNDAPVKGLVSIRTASEYLDCSIQQVRNLTEQGKLHVVKIDARDRYKMSELQRFVEMSTQGR